MALARFREATGSWPESLTELIPAYLPELPIDPLDPDERPLKYRRDGDSYLRYSIGLNGVDDGGAAPEKDDDQYQPRTGDLRLDLYFAHDDGSTGMLPTDGDSDETPTETDNPSAYSTKPVE